MSTAECQRSFEAAALRDDRLDVAERASFERHASVCAVCSSEVQALELLAEPLRDGSPHDVDELHARRERRRLLTAFDRTFVAPERRPVKRRTAFTLAVPTLAALIGGALFWRMQHPELPVRALIRADSSAVWSRHVEGLRERVVLERGALFIRVEQHASAKTQLLVVLPDGELEDIGTTFSVSAQAGHTTRVSVQEGSVVLRLRGFGPLVLAAGETWSPPAQACPPSVQPAAAPPAVESLKPARVKRVSEKPDSAADFRAAVAVLEAGKPEAAAAAFARFGAKYPRDPRAEDAAYMRVIALQKLGAADPELKRAAQQYLARFPAGLRRVEVSPLASDP
jgi:hypothetical protein